MTWNTLSEAEENQIYEQHDKLHLEMTNINLECALDKNNDVFIKYL